MSLPMYLLRRSLSNVSNALYSPGERDITVHIIKPQLDSHFSSEQAALLQVTDEDSLENGHELTYAQLLELILKAEKVVTL